MAIFGDMKTECEHTVASRFHRLFVAISTPDVVKSKIEKVQHEMRQTLPVGSVRWTSPEHFHLTLRFLGNVAVERIAELSGALRIACSNFAPLTLRAEHIDFFPVRGFPRVIWTAVSNRDQQLDDLQSAIQSETLQFTSEPNEKQFTGHITLGRAKTVTRHEADALANFAAKMHGYVLGEWVASSVELFRSELLPDGAHHTILNTIPLAGAK